MNSPYFDDKGNRIGPGRVLRPVKERLKDFVFHLLAFSMWNLGALGLSWVLIYFLGWFSIAAAIFISLVLAIWNFKNDLW